MVNFIFLTFFFQVVWQFGQYEYKKSPVSKYRIHVSDDNSLHIRNFQSTDHGTYTCVYRVCDFQVNKSAELKLIKGKFHVSVN